MTLNSIDADSTSSGFEQRVQGADMERVSKTKRSSRIILDAPIRQDDWTTLLERRKMAQIHERASALENENLALRSRIEVLEQLAFVDSLTGLPNRLSLEQHITRAHDHARASGETLAFAIADIDLFKLVNDRFGHATGDAVLREVGLILRSQNWRPTAGNCGSREVSVAPDARRTGCGAPARLARFFHYTPPDYKLPSDFHRQWL